MTKFVYSIFALWITAFAFLPKAETPPKPAQPAAWTANEQELKLLRTLANNKINVVSQRIDQFSDCQSKQHRIIKKIKRPETDLKTKQ